jgi:hypothetical protein
MKRLNLLYFILGLFIIGLFAFADAKETKKEAIKKPTPTNSIKNDKPWQDTFPVDKQQLGLMSNNPYFPLEPGYQQVFKEGTITLTRTVLKEMKIIDGVAIRVVEDKEDDNGQLVEIAHDYYAIDTITQNVYYFGEDVDNYKNGRIENHGGSWLSGIKSARFGLQMPGTIKVGHRFYQELAPEIAMDRAEIVATNQTVKTPAGTFTKCIKVEETSGLEKGALDYKWYAPGIGMVKDNEMTLTKISMPKK